MYKKLLVLAACFFVSAAWADTSLEPLLNSIVLELSAEQWVTTKTALVTIGVSAAVNDHDIGKIQTQIKNKLAGLAPQSDWHITSLNRSEDQSGLEKVQITAQARLSDADLSGLREKTKNLTKPGETFSLDNVEFTPTEDETRAANVQLRTNIYQQARDEIDRLNKLNPEEKYYIHSINFLGRVFPTQARNANIVMMQVRAGDSMNANLPVSDKLKVTALVMLAAAPNQDVIKMIH